MFTAQAAEHLHNYLTGVLCARGLTGRTRTFSVQDMRDRWKHGHSTVEEIQDSEKAVSLVAEHLADPQGVVVASWT